MGAQSSSRISPVNDFTRTEYEITIPGNEIPIWFNHQCMGNYISFWIGPEIPTFALCVAFGMKNASCDFHYQVDMSSMVVNECLKEKSIRDRCQIVYVFPVDLRAFCRSNFRT